MPGEFGFRYAYSSKQITDVLEKAHAAGRPDKLTLSYLRDTWLLKDAQYTAVLAIMKDMGFLDDTGAPLDLYAEYQNPALRKRALAKGIRRAYPGLFKAYPKAYMPQEKEIVSGYFKQQTGAEKSVADRITNTFYTLCNLADFSEEPGDAATAESLKQTPSSVHVPAGVHLPTGESTTLVPITMNIQIVIPSDATAEKYDEIFASIKKFLTTSSQ